MNPLARLLYSDDLRKTRFHTATGTLCLNPVQMARGLASTLLRYGTGKLLDLPWLTYPAIDWIKTLPRDIAVFEYGSGMSTAWYGRRFREVHAVESNPEWFAKVNPDRLANVHVSLEQDKARYLSAIDRTPVSSFDLIIIDGEYRLDCIPKALAKLRPDGFLIIDNVDVEPALSETMRRVATKEMHPFPGYGPGAFHAWETRAWIV